jgi:adenosylmethionine-8-amino-7-oxononanoate aminotransferase
MRMYDPLYLKLLREACDATRVHLIADESQSVSGRTGTMFACEQAGIRPDYLCLSKGLTGGYLPLSVVLTTDAIYDAFYDEYGKLKAFLHSHSYTGNPLACAAANATLGNLSRRAGARTQSCHRGAHARERRAPAGPSARRRDPPVRHDSRHRAHAGSLRRERPGPGTNGAGCASTRTRSSAARSYVPLGTTIYFMPPYVIAPEEIELLARVATEGIELACA